MKKFLALFLSLVLLIGTVACVDFSALADECEHTNIVLENQKAATTSEGYTGDKVCEDCGKVIEEGEVIPVLPTGWQTVDGKTYYYDEKGNAVKGWKLIDGLWYYFNDDASMYTGWLKSGKYWYYLNQDGVMLTHLQTIDGKKYLFSQNGALQTGWQKIDNKWYYFNNSGAMMKGWIKVKDKWYYLNSNGVMQTGWVKVSGKWYYLNSNGVMQTGWIKVSGKQYYLNKSGVMQTGWIKISGKWYYLNSNGVKQTGWIKVSGKWYYLNSNGVMQTGWVKVSGKWYYLNSNGVMQTGWKKINGAWYYFDSNGKMATDWKSINGKWYYFGTNGVMQTGYVNVYATYTSKYSNNANRTNNLKISSAAIDGTILKPGDTFDFNAVVGWRTPERGYKKAPVFLGATERGEDYGGGVCQTSSTVFNAALLANLQIVERHQHSQTVSYVPLGRDAAISGSAKNMRFKNNTNYTIKIGMTVKDGYITCTLYTVEHVQPPKVTISVTKSGNKYTMKRYVNGSCNYTTTSTF